MFKDLKTEEERVAEKIKDLPAEVHKEVVGIKTKILQDVLFDLNHFETEMKDADLGLEDMALSPLNALKTVFQGELDKLWVDPAVGKPGVAS
jgi:hypothetical protein